MSVRIHLKELIYLTLTTLVILIFVWHLNSNANLTAISFSNHKYSDVLIASDIYKIKRSWFLNNCLSENFGKMSLEFLPEYISKFESSTDSNCRNVARIFYSMFELEKLYSEVVLNEDFEKKVLKWLDNNPSYLQQAHRQKVIKLYNKFLHEEMIFNPLRGKRPQAPNQLSDKNYSFSLIEETKKNCDFCERNYIKNTASDVFDRIETDLSYTAANTFKYDKWHSLVMSRNHNPLQLSEEEVIDMFKVCLKWFAKVNTLDNKATYPELIWDAMPKAGASQVHTHLQVSMGLSSYYGGMRRILDAASHYFILNQRNFFSDFILVHKALGLANKYNQTYVILNMIAVKEQEIMLIGENNQESYDTISRLLHRIIKIFVEDFEQYSYSLGMYIPAYDKSKLDLKANDFFPRDDHLVKDTELNSDKLRKIFCRIVFRTPVTSLRSDVNGLDLYTSSVLGIDRYTIANKLFKKLDNYK